MSQPAETPRGSAGERRLRVAVTGLEGRDNPYPGCAIAGALRAARGDTIEIVGLAYDPLLTGCFRRDLFDAVHLVPYPSDPAETQLARLLALHAAAPIDVLIPALDTEVAVVAGLAPVLERHGIRTLLPSPASVRMRMKPRLVAFARAGGFATPRTETIVDLERFFDQPEWGFPCWLKGAWADAERVADRAEARAAHARLVAKWGYPILAQDSVVGDEYDVCAVAWPEGEIAAMVAIRKVALSPLGKGIAAITVADRALEGEARALVRALRWRGPLELELVRESSSGRFFLIEINARFPAWVGMTPKTGVNLPELLLRIARGEAVAGAGAAPGTLFVRTSRTTIGRVRELGGLAATGSTGRAPAVPAPDEAAAHGSATGRSR